MSKNDISVEEAVELLTSGLTEDERDSLMGIKHDLNANIRWGKVVEESFGPILASMESLIFHGGEGLVKPTVDPSLQAPIYSLFASERARLEEGDKAQLSRHFVTLLLTKKLLGALKTRVNQSLNDIQTLTEEEEFDAMCALDEGPSEIIDAEFREETEDMRGEPDPEIVARIGFRDNWNCEHVVTKVRHIKADGFRFQEDRLETFCKDCRNVIGVRVIPKSQKAGKKSKKKKQGCQHRYAEWVPGKEGQTAQCVDEKNCTHLITAEIELKRIHWEKAGLEPYGDDPSQDEVIAL